MPVDSDYHVPPGYIRFVQKLISQHPYDLLWINFLNNAHLAVKSKSSAQILIDIHDIHCHTRLAKKPRFSQKLKFDYKDNFEKEVKLLNKFDTVIVNSQDELNLLKPNLLLQKLYLIPHLIESVASISNIPTYQNRKFKYDLLFVGTGGHSPNVEGIKFFLGSIFPKVVFARANVKLAIAGTVNKFVQLNESFKKNVDCLGYVPDLSDLYLQSKLVICPLLSGAGTKVKIQEAMVFGIPVVTTTVGASGMKLVNAVNAFITDEPELFAEKILHLLEKPELAQNISENIFQLFNSDYSNSAIYSKLDRMLGILSS